MSDSVSTSEEMNKHKSRLLYRELHNSVGVDRWLHNDGSMCCWLDTEPFVGPIYSFPVRQDLDRWIVRGIFCSLHCTKRYIIDNCLMNNSIFTLFSLMCNQVYKVGGEITPAPPFQLLKKFCTDSVVGMNISEFRDCGPSSRIIRIVHPPVYPFMFDTAHVCEQRLEKQSSISDEFRLLDPLALSTRDLKIYNNKSDNSGIVNIQEEDKKMESKQLGKFFPVKPVVESSESKDVLFTDDESAESSDYEDEENLLETENIDLP